MEGNDAMGETENQLAVGLDGFGIEDRISRLPDLCLLEVFKHLKRRDIFNSRTLNKRIHPLTKDRKLDNIKWQGGKLSIFPVTRGYSFRLTVGPDYPRNRVEEGTGTVDETSRFSYYYSTWENDYGLIGEMKFTSASANIAPISIPPHGLIIPDKFFRALTNILSIHEVAVLDITNVAFDTPSLFTRLNHALIGHQIELLDCNMPCSALTEDTKTSFIHFIKTFREVDLRRSIQVPSLINESFLCDISSSKLRIFHERKLSATERMANTFRFLEAKIPDLVRINTLEAPAMILDKSLVAKFCMMYMDSRGADYANFGTWRFSIDCRFFVPVEVHSYLRHSDYTSTTSTGTSLDLMYDCFIVRKADNMTACIRFWVSDDDDVALLHLPRSVITVDFMIRPENEWTSEDEDEVEGDSEDEDTESDDEYMYDSGDDDEGEGGSGEDEELLSGDELDGLEAMDEELLSGDELGEVEAMEQ